MLGRQRKLKPTPGSEDWSSAGDPGRPIPVDGITIGPLVRADAYQPPPALRLRDSGAQLLVSAAAWWPGECVVDRGEKLLTLRASESTVFIVDCQFSDGHIAKCEL